MLSVYSCVLHWQNYTSYSCKEILKIFQKSKVVGWYKMVGEEIRRPLGINNTSGQDDFLPPNKWPDPLYFPISCMPSWKMALTVPFHKLIFWDKTVWFVQFFNCLKKWPDIRTSCIHQDPDTQLLIRSPFTGAIFHSKDSPVQNFENICETLTPRSFLSDQVGFC